MVNLMRSQSQEHPICFSCSTMRFHLSSKPRPAPGISPAQVVPGFSFFLQFALDHHRGGDGCVVRPGTQHALNPCIRFHLISMSWRVLLRACPMCHGQPVASGGGMTMQNGSPWPPASARKAPASIHAWVERGLDPPAGRNAAPVPRSRAAPSAAEPD